MFFHQTTVKEPLGPLLRSAREARVMTLEDASRASRLSVDEIRLLEEDRPSDIRFSRLQTVIYARALGIDPLGIRKYLPPAPALNPGNLQYLANMARPLKVRMIPPAQILAPLGRMVLYLLLAATLLSTWGMMRQLSRVRSIPWITSSSRLSSFSGR